MGDVHASAESGYLAEHTWSRKYLFYSQILVVLIHNGLSCWYLVFYE